MKLNTEGYPVLEAYEDAQGCLRIWCIYCCSWHHHGNSEGHRVAHCIVTDSPYRKTGYFIKRIGVLTEKVRKQHRERRPVRCKSRSCSSGAFLSPANGNNQLCAQCEENRKIRQLVIQSTKENLYLSILSNRNS